MTKQLRRVSIDYCKQLFLESKDLGKKSKKAVKKALTTETSQRIYMNMTF